MANPFAASSSSTKLHENAVGTEETFVTFTSMVLVVSFRTQPKFITVYSKERLGKFICPIREMLSRWGWSL